MENKPLEEIYRYKDHVQHILDRPGMYIGNISPISEEKWVLENGRFIRRNLEYIPGFYKIFDEIVTNAADHATNYPDNVKKIRIDIDSEENKIVVWNDGPGIPVEVHKELQIYIPEMCFGKLLTSTNYDDSKTRFTGGLHGEGGKLTNIFSKKFIVETADGKHKFRQVFQDNMSKRGNPEITKCAKNYTQITFFPDLNYFKMNGKFSADFLKIAEKRAYDISACLPPSVKVYFNGALLPVKKFEQYANLFIGDKKESKRFYEHNADKSWEVIVAISETGFQQVSFVNGIDTSHGGTHVDYIVNQISKHLRAKRNSEDIKPHMIRDKLLVFINCKINQPAFSSQTKEKLTTPVSQFATKIDLSEKFCDNISKEIIQEMQDMAAQKKLKTLAKQTDGAKTAKIHGIANFEDALWAGGARSSECTLVLCEGLSAQALVLAGFNVVGKERYGCYPLKGKLINPKKSEEQALKNKELNDIKQILGLKQGAKYADVSKLRYGRILVCTDQDLDGHHIKALIANVFHTWWPELLQIRGFFCSLATPIVKISKGNQELAFYNLTDYNEWKQNTPAANSWKTKYYKGLGTSDRDEGQEYFSNLAENLITFSWSGENCDSSLKLAFSEDKADARKDWLLNYNPDQMIQRKQATSWNDFIHEELVQFSMADNVRSIPRINDGLKPSLRKILYSAFKRKLSDEIKVAQFSGYISEHTSYHHGEQSLNGAIITMAQNYVGANNINLLVPKGMFGTRSKGGKDAASPRYIYTTLEKITTVIFNQAENALLKYLDDDGTLIEPETYYPILPMILVNGASGIGTGWKSDVPCFNPWDILKILRNWLNGDALVIPSEVALQPWYRGFKGNIDQVSEKKYKISGIWKRISANEIQITELPIGVWTNSYNDFLEETFIKRVGKKQPQFEIEDFVNNSTDIVIDFAVKFKKSADLDALIAQNDVENVFHLNEFVNYNNLILFNSEGKIQRYNSPGEILAEFYDIRLKVYAARKQHLLDAFQKEYDVLYWKVRFIELINSRELIVFQRKRADVIADLAARNFMQLDGSFDYLLNMSIAALTEERAADMRAKMLEKQAEFDQLRGKTPETMWLEDLDEFEKIYADFLENAGRIQTTRKRKAPETKTTTKPRKKIARQ